MSKKVIFRADGNSKTGLGHLYRLFSIVEIIKNTLDYVYLTHQTTPSDIIPKDYNVRFIPDFINTEDEPDWLAVNFSPNEYIIIADGYHFSSGYQKQIKNKGYRLLYIDDLAKEHMYADIVINHSPYIQENHYSKASYTKLALGTQYALLRPSFLKEAKKQDKQVTTISNVFVCFGGADPFDLTYKSVMALIELEKVADIHIVVGGAYEHKKIFEVQNDHLTKINVYKNLSEIELLELMKLCDFAIAPASTILYELCCVKMPILSGYYVDNQELIYKGFLNNNAIYRGGNMADYEVLDFERKINEILNENSFNNQIKAQEALFDNKIALRHLNLISDLCLQ